jgi:hypothetical protein
VSVSGPGSGAFVTFDTSSSPTVNARVGVSYVSVANATANAKAEQGSRGFDTIAKAARAAWNDRLGQIEITGGTTEQRTIFYTSLYHAMVQPNVFSDANGQYIGFDGATHQVAKGHAQYANFSGWDIYRCEVQLLALLAPREAADIAQSMYNQAHQAGDLWDRWSQNNDFSGVMTGDPYHSILASMYAFGATDFDAAGALTSMVHGATTIQPNSARYTERYGLAAYQRVGYLPDDPSSTLEYTAADFGIATLAQRLGRTDIHRQFMARAQYWENLFNPDTGYLEPRGGDGSFTWDFDPGRHEPYIEGNGAQYTWMVPYNLRGLFNAMGGDPAVRQRLDTFFTELNAGADQPYAFLGNEPSLGVPWAYAYAGAPYRTQDVVRRATNTLWRATEDGFVGNDDLGAMSSWYVWSALGLYPQVPGRAELVVGSPLFPHIVVHRPNRPAITIDAPNASASTYYVHGLKVNGMDTTRAWLPESFVRTGGTLAFTMADTPDTSWGASPADAPPSFRDGETPYRAAINPTRVQIESGGAPATATLTVQSISAGAGTASWVATPPPGITVTPASGPVDVPATGAGSVSLTVSAAAGTADGSYRVPITLTAPNGAAPVATPLSVTVAKKGSMLALYDNVGISDDTAPDQANFDSGGYSYSAQALTAAGVRPGGTVTAGGFTFTWPADPVAQPDNIWAAGQTIDLTGTPATATALSFLGAGSGRDAEGTITITYTDGSTQSVDIGLGDWTLSAGAESIPYGNVVAARTPYRNNVSGVTDQVLTYVFATAAIPLAAGKQVASVTLPNNEESGAMHVFAVATR